MESVLLCLEMWEIWAPLPRIDSGLRLFKSVYAYVLFQPCIWTMVIVHKCAILSVRAREKAKEHWGRVEECPSGKMQRGRRKHGKGSRNTWRTWPTAKSSLADLGKHNTLMQQPQKLSLVKAYMASYCSRLPLPHACKHCTQIKIWCSQTRQCS